MVLRHLRDMADIKRITSSFLCRFGQDSRDVQRGLWLGVKIGEVWNFATIFGILANRYRRYAIELRLNINSRIVCSKVSLLRKNFINFPYFRSIVWEIDRGLVRSNGSKQNTLFA